MPSPINHLEGVTLVILFKKSFKEVYCIISDLLGFIMISGADYETDESYLI